MPWRKNRDRSCSIRRINAGITESESASRSSQEAAEAELMALDEKLMLMEQQLEDARTRMMNGMNESASIHAQDQRFEAMLEQVQVRRSEVVRNFLKFKSDESVQDEQLDAERKGAGETRARPGSTGAGPDRGVRDR